MKTKKLLISLLLSLGLILAFMVAIGGGVPAARATGIVVQTALDGVANDGKCTLREAIIAANTDTAGYGCNAGAGHDSISLKPGTYALTLVGGGEDSGMTGDLDVAAPLTIVGAGPDKTYIDAKGIDRVFDILSGAGTVVLSDLTVINGNVTGAGGGIRSDGANLTLINVEIVSNTAGGSSLPNGRGGGVFIDGGSLLLDRGQILSNTAGVWGGGIHLHGTATVFTQTGSTTIAHNHSNDEGGGLSILSARATITGGQIFSNTAGSDGGGVYTRSPDTILKMTDVQIAGNDAGGYGGGIEIYGGGVTVSGGQIISNRADSGGGGIRVANSTSVLTQTGASLIAYNTAPARGGIYVLNGRAALEGAQIVSNTARYSGGGIVVSNNGEAILTNVTVSGNEATEQFGGGIQTTGALTMTHTTIASNTAASGGGGIDRSDPGVIWLQNTLVAHNTPANCNAAINLTSTGYNLDSGPSCNLDATGDITDTNPLLGPLTNDGGVWVHPLLENSPAIDAGDPAFTPPPEYDQRGPGFSRVVAGRVDIGAYEAAANSLFTYLPLVLKN